MTQPASPEQTKTRKQWWVENVTSLALALLLVFMIRSSVIEAFKIPSGSMIPTLLIGDHIFVNKFAYGIKIPFSDLVTDHPVYLIKRDPPKHGDIIVFIYPKDESFYYIKRVIGIAGDTIEMRNKVLLINGKEVKRDPLPADQTDQILTALDSPRYNKSDLDLFMEHLDGHDHVMMQERGNYMGENFGPVVVPPDSLFVMGDNRDQSNDSRYWGFVPMKNVKGRAFVIWLSIWFNFSDQEFKFRPLRTGTILH